MLQAFRQVNSSIKEGYNKNPEECSFHSHYNVKCTLLQKTNSKFYNFY